MKCTFRNSSADTDDPIDGVGRILYRSGLPRRLHLRRPDRAGSYETISIRFKNVLLAGRAPGRAISLIHLSPRPYDGRQSHGVPGGFFLVSSGHFALECEPFVLHRHPDAGAGHVEVALERLYEFGGNLSGGPFGKGGASMPLAQP